MSNNASRAQSLSRLHIAVMARNRTVHIPFASVVGFGSKSRLEDTSVSLRRTSSRTWWNLRHNLARLLRRKVPSPGERRDAEPTYRGCHKGCRGPFVGIYAFSDAALLRATSPQQRPQYRKKRNIADNCVRFLVTNSNITTRVGEAGSFHVEGTE